MNFHDLFSGFLVLFFGFVIFIGPIIAILYWDVIISKFKNKGQPIPDDSYVEIFDYDNKCCIYYLPGDYNFYQKINGKYYKIFFDSKIIDNFLTNSHIWRNLNDYYHGCFPELPEIKNYKYILGNKPFLTKENHFFKEEYYSNRFKLFCINNLRIKDYVDKI